MMPGDLVRLVAGGLIRGLVVVVHIVVGGVVGRPIVPAAVRRPRRGELPRTSVLADPAGRTLAAGLERVGRALVPPPMVLDPDLGMAGPVLVADLPRGVGT